MTTQTRTIPTYKQKQRQDYRYVVWLSLCTLALLTSIVAAVVIGSVNLPFDTVVRIILHRAFPDVFIADWTPIQEQIVWDFRLPRVLLAVIVGAALSVTGATLQALLRNPLADPYIFGVSMGASVGAVVVITLGIAVVGAFTLSFAAFGGALLTMILVYLVAQQRGQLSPTRLLLAGVAMSYMLSAVTTFLVLQASTPGNNNAAIALTWLAAGRHWLTS